VGDTALKLAQIALEGPYSGGSSPKGVASVYNGGSAQQATRRIAIEKSMGSDFKYVFDAPEEARGTYAGQYQHVLEAVMASGKLPSLIYCDDFAWYGRMALSGTPTVVTLPNTPTTLVSQGVISATITPTGPQQPNAQTDGAAAKMIGITLFNATADTGAVTFTINGTDVFGNAITPAEQIVFGTGTETYSYFGTGTPQNSCTLYSKNYYKTITTITSSAQPSGDQVTVLGINAFQWTFLPDMGTSTLYSATMEYYDGTGSWQVPGVVLEKLGVTMSIGKSMTADMSFAAQQKSQMPLSASPRIAASAAGTLGAMTNLADNVMAAMTAYKTTLFSGAIGTDPAAATQVSSRLVEYKFDLETGAKVGKAADGTPFGSFVGRGFYKVGAEMTLLFNQSAGATFDPVDVGNFLYPTTASRVWRVVMPGPNLPCGAIAQTGNSSGWPQQVTGASNAAAGMYALIVDIAGRTTEITEKDVDGRMAFAFKIGSEVDLQFLGAQARMIIITRVGPNTF
jgi:hypothetical protein